MYLLLVGDVGHIIRNENSSYAMHTYGTQELWADVIHRSWPPRDTAGISCRGIIHVGKHVSH